LPLVVVQPGIVYGPGDHSIVHRVLLQFLHGDLHAAPRGAAYCWSHVDDVARGHLLAMEKGRIGESYILAGPLHTTTEVFELASRVSGLPMPKWRPAPRTMQLLAEVARVVGALVPLPDNYRYESLRVMAGVTYGGSSAKAERELGWTYRPLEVGLRETILDCMRELNMRAPNTAPSRG
jgi:nucleoside-diphosphate-sugar epimerase